MWQQGHGHNYKHDEYTDIDLFANFLLNTTKSYVLCLLTSSSARQKWCLPLWRLRSYYFSRHDPTQTLASVECLLLYDGDGPPRADSKVPPGCFLADRRTQTQITPDISDGCCSPVRVANLLCSLFDSLSETLPFMLRARARTGTSKESHGASQSHSQKGPSSMF